MTSDEREDDFPAPAPEYLAIDALLDGEAVDRHTVAASLEHRAVRDYLVDALLLRQATRDLEPPSRVAPIATSPRSRSMRGVAAAAILALSTFGGYLYGHDGRDVAPGFADVILDASSQRSAPAPTQSIRFEPGVNWTEREGMR